jgi:iron complex transport system ATP-binding protein
MSETDFRFQQICFSYGEHEVLHNVSAEVESGKITAVFGPNGSGKTTLLRCLAGLSRPTSGEVLVNGLSLYNMNPKERSRRLAYVPQEHVASFAYTVAEVVLMGRTPHLGGIPGPKESDYLAAQEALNAVGIEDLANRAFTELSGGQRQLVLIARALAQETPIIIMDEPTSALDFRNQLLVWRKLGKMKSVGKTVLVCTHDPNHVIWFCDSMVCLQDGVVIADGSTAELMNGELMERLYGSVCLIRDGMVMPSFG